MDKTCSDCYEVGVAPHVVAIKLCTKHGAVDELIEALQAAAENNHSFHAVNGNGDRVRLVECEVEACVAARTAIASYEGTKS